MPAATCGPVTCRLNGDHANAAVPVRRRQLLVETLRDRAHLRLGLLESHVRAKSSDDEPGIGAAHAAADFPIRKHRVRLPHIGVEPRKLETRGENADDSRGTSVKLDGRADGIVRAAETRLPEAMTDQDQTLPLLGLLGREAAPLQGLNAKQRKEVG